MKWHVLILSAAIAVPAGPAFAACADDVARLEEQYQQAEGGSAGTASTEHQAGTLGTGQSTGTAGGVAPESAGSGPAAAGSEHQREVLRGEQPASGQERFAELIQEAKQLSEQGDEAGCTERLTAAQGLMGTK